MGSSSKSRKSKRADGAGGVETSPPPHHDKNREKKNSNNNNDGNLKNNSKKLSLSSSSSSVHRMITMVSVFGVAVLAVVVRVQLMDEITTFLTHNGWKSATTTNNNGRMTATATSTNSAPMQKVQQKPPTLQLQSHPTKKKTTTNQPQCGLYLAPSSIPNSGLGVFAGKDYPTGISFAPPEVGHVLILEDEHPPKPGQQQLYPSDNFYTSIVQDYTWHGHSSGGTFESRFVLSLIPGMGMAANSFLPQINTKSIQQRKKQPPPPSSSGSSSNNDRKLNSPPNSDGPHYHHPGLGSYSNHYDIEYVTTKDLVTGNEIFPNYGAQYFYNRRDKFGILPLQKEFDLCDEIVTKLYQSLPNQLKEKKNTASSSILDDDDEMMDATTTIATTLQDWQPMWDVVLQEFIRDEGYRKAFPLQFQDLQRAAQRGCANNYLQGNNPRTVDWLQDHGYCMDTVDIRTSAIPYAGRGAFVKQGWSFNTGDIILPVPVLPISREALNIYADPEYTQVHSQQLLLNYCFGLPNSPIVLMPYSSSVSFVNHGGPNSNAKLIWSSSATDVTQFHQDRWLNMTSKQLLQQEYAGLMLQIVAKRTIQAGEEVTIDYGPEWESAWQAYVENWETTHQKQNNLVTAAELNDNPDNRVVRTVFEESYPTNVGLACHYQFGHTWEQTVAQRNPPFPIDKRQQKNSTDGFEALYTSWNGDGADEYQNAMALSKLRTQLNSIFRRSPNWMEPNENVNFHGGVNLRPCKILARGTQPPPSSNVQEEEESLEDCRTVRNDHARCEEWATSKKPRSECQENPVWMLQHCKESCRVCEVPSTPIRDYRNNYNEEEDYYLVRVYNRHEHLPWDKIPTDTMAQYVKNVPRHAIVFVDRPYTSYQHHVDAFRHPIGFPTTTNDENEDDEDNDDATGTPPPMWPKSWMN